MIFFFNDTATTEIYTLSLHDALPISRAPAPPARHHGRRHSPSRPRLRRSQRSGRAVRSGKTRRCCDSWTEARRDRFVRDRKSTRLNSSHLVISYAVFCLKKQTILIAV